MTATVAEPQAPTLDSVIGELVRVLRSLGREDLAGRATAAGARLQRPTTIVCVVGEFKQGKSSLVNGLLGQPIARSTTTWRRRRSRSCATARSRRASCAAARTATQAVGRAGARSRSSADWVSEAGNPRNEKRVERVEITVAEPAPEAGARRRRHARHGRARRRPRGRDARRSCRSPTG